MKLTDSWPVQFEPVESLVRFSVYAPCAGVRVGSEDPEGFTVQVKLAVPVFDPGSVAVTTTVPVPAVVGVPLTSPLAALIDSPAGSPVAE